MFITSVAKKRVSASFFNFMSCAKFTNASETGKNGVELWK